MNGPNVVAVITTINEKSEAILTYEKIALATIVIIGDIKTPHMEGGDISRYFSIDSQSGLGFSIAEVLPYNHYCRKNIGYLIAMQSGAEIIYDTDDDNMPLDNWYVPDFVSSLEIKSKTSYINIYKYFTEKKVWPRGYPLSQINSCEEQVVKKGNMQNIAVWQGLANGDPDVDAIYRLIDNEEVIFDEMPSVFLKQGVYCPFNSQNTFWKKEFFPLLYLPATTSFRFTDILRGYIAQRIIWDEGYCLGFMSATVFQDRNPHNYMCDFEEEIEVYLNVEKVVQELDSIKLHGNLTDKLKIVYQRLSELSIVSKDELGILDAWVLDYKAL